MRVEALAALEVGEASNEFESLGPPRGFDHHLFGRVGAAVENVVPHGAVQQRGILRDHADIGAQRILRDFGDVLPVDQDAPALDVVEAQEQVDQRRLARAGAPHQADFLAGPDCQRQVLDHALLLPVVEADMVQNDLAVRNDKFLRAGLVLDEARQRDRCDAVLYGADILEQAGHLPHDPLRHAPQADDETDRRRDRADGHHLAEPKPYAEAGDCREAQRVQQVEQPVEGRDHAELAVDGLEEVTHAFSGVGRFAAGMAEQLDGLDVRVAVDHAAGHHRPRIGLLFADPAELGNEVAQQRDVADEPDGERQRQPPVRRSHDDQHSGEIDDDVVQHVRELHDGLAHGERRLHQLGGDAACELVLVEGHRLLQQVTVHLPADPHRVVADQRLHIEKRLAPDHQRQRHQHDRGHACEPPSLVGEEGVSVRRRQPVDDVAEEGEHPHLGRRDQRRQDR